MKKKLFLIFITIITIIIINPLKVNAEEKPIMAIDCKAGTLKEEKTKKIADSNASKWYFYRLTEKEDTAWYFYDGTYINKVIAHADINNCHSVEGQTLCKEQDNELTILEQGKCPTTIMAENLGLIDFSKTKQIGDTGRTLGKNIFISGETDATNISKMSEGEYYFIDLTPKDDKSIHIIYSYYYSKDGTIRATNLGNTASDNSSPFFELLDYQIYLIASGNKNFYEATIDNGYKKYIEYFHSDITENAYNINYIFGNRINRTLFDSQVEEWYNSNKLSVDGLNTVTSNVKSQKKELINACTSLNKKSQQNETYKFGTYSPEKMINDLNSVYNDYSNINSSFTFCSQDLKGEAASLENSATNCVLTGLLGNYLYAAEDFEKKLGGDLYQYIQKDILETLNNKYTVNNSQSDMNEVLETLTACTINLDNKYDSFGIDKNEISNLREKYVELAGNYNITVVIDCESLLGQELIDRINSYLKIIKIAIPLILIAFGIVDFAKAVFSSSDDDMKKAQKDFIKRLGIAILIFFVPTIINLLLSIANKVWINIYPNSCGLF